MRHLVLIAALGTASGCTLPSAFEAPPGMSEEQQKKELAECHQEALERTAMVWGGGEYVYYGFRKKCMERKGWVRE